MKFRTYKIGGIETEIPRNHSLKYIIRKLLHFLKIHKFIQINSFGPSYKICLICGKIKR